MKCKMSVTNRGFYDSFFPEELRECPSIDSFGSNYCSPQINIVKDYRVLENQQDPGAVSLMQNVNTRHIRIENNSSYPLLIGINLTRDWTERPSPQFLLRGGEARDLAVNMPGQNTQFMWIYSPITNKVVADPHPLRWNINQYVIMEGQNRFWTMDFYHKGYRPQF